MLATLAFHRQRSLSSAGPSPRSSTEMLHSHAKCDFRNCAREPQSFALGRRPTISTSLSPGKKSLLIPFSSPLQTIVQGKQEGVSLDASQTSDSSYYAIVVRSRLCKHCTSWFQETLTLGRHTSRYGRKILKSFKAMGAVNNASAPPVKLSNAETASRLSDLA